MQIFVYDGMQRLCFSNDRRNTKTMQACRPWVAHPDFGRSVNPISTRGDRLCPPNYYWHTRIFRPSDGPAMYSGTKIKDYIIFAVKKFAQCDMIYDTFLH